MAGINIASGFDLSSPIPLDGRTVTETLITRDAIASGKRYEGLKVFVKSEGKEYQLIGGISNTNWTVAQADADLTKINQRLDSTAQQLADATDLVSSASKGMLSVKDIKDMSYTDTNGFFILWMDKDGVIYATKEKGLYQSVDNGKNYTHLHTFEQTASGVRSLDNGELIVAIEKTSTQNSRIYKSSANKTAFTLVLTATSIEVSYHGGWGMDVKGNNVVISEYGKYNHAVHAFLSKDGGSTFTQILNLTEVATQSTLPHIHGIAYDEYFDRIWIAHGDHDGNVYYTDDFGANWVKAYSSSQLLNIFVLEDCVLFGSDSAPNAIFRYNRGKKEDVAVIELAYKLDDHGSITYIPYSTYRRDKKSPVIMTWMFMEGFSQPTGSKIITTTFDGKTFQRIWTDTGSHDVSQIITAYAPTNDGKLIGSQKGDKRFANGTTIKGSFDYGFIENTPIISAEYRNQERRPYVDIRSLGVIGNGTNESMALEKAINFAGERHLSLVIPRHMTIMVKDTVIKNKHSFDLICHGTIKTIPLASGTTANAVKFINCSDVNIPIINFDGNSDNSGGSTLQKFHTFMTFESCNNVSIGELNAVKVVGNIITIDESNMMFTENLKALSDNKGANLITIKGGSTVKFNKIVSRGVADNSFTSNLISIEPKGASTVIEDITFRNVDIETNASRVITAKNTVGARVDTIEFKDARIYTKGEELFNVVELTGITNLKADMTVHTNQKTPADFKGIGFFLDDVTYLDCKLKAYNVMSGVYLGSAKNVREGKLDLTISDVKTAGVHLGKLEDMTINADLNNSSSLNMTILAGNNLKDVLITNSKFRKGTNNYRNVNMYNAVCDNVIFKDNDFSEWNTLVEKLEINLPGVKRITNLGLNYLSAAPNDSRYWNVGEIVYNTAPTVGGYIGWICTASGAPGTWKGFGLIAE